MKRFVILLALVLIFSVSQDIEEDFVEEVYEEPAVVIE
jgi:hypothetical protein